MTVSEPLPTDLIDGLLENYKKPEYLIGENDLLKKLTKALVELMLEAEMTEHLGHDKHEIITNIPGNAHNGYTPAIIRVIYTTNAIESVNMSLRKITKNRGSFSNDESLMKHVLSSAAEHQ